MAGPFESHAAVFHTALSVADFALSLSLCAMPVV